MSGRLVRRFHAYQKRGSGHLVISIAIGQQQFDEVICDIGSSINIIPKVIYDNVLQFGPFLHMTMRLRFVDRSTRQVEGIADNICVRIGHSYVPVDWVVLFYILQMPPYTLEQPKYVSISIKE
jgi:hypothetical protein